MCNSLTYWQLESKSKKMVSRGPRNTKITWCHLWTLKSEIFESLSLELTEIWNLNVYEMEIKNFEFFYLLVQQGLSWVPDQNKYILSCCWVPPGNISQPEPESKEERQERNKSLKDFSDDLFSAMLVEEWSGSWHAVTKIKQYRVYLFHKPSPITRGQKF